MRAKAVIESRLPGLNEYVNACRSNRYAGAKMKRDVQDVISVYIRDLPEFTKPVRIHFHWIEENRRRDLDNCCFAKKFILDALVECGKLKGDSQKYVVGFTDTFEVDKWPRVMVEIEEA